LNGGKRLGPCSSGGRAAVGKQRARAVAASLPCPTDVAVWVVRAFTLMLMLLLRPRCSFVHAKQPPYDPSFLRHAAGVRGCPPADVTLGPYGLYRNTATCHFAKPADSEVYTSRQSASGGDHTGKWSPEESHEG
jgi:hypothetical protein